MFDELKGRRVLVTGASRGIGAAEARRIVDEAAEQLCGLDLLINNAGDMLGRGNIIHTGSIAARNGGGPGPGLYASAKGFVTTLTRNMAKELAGDRIRVNAVAPGVITTDFHERHSNGAQLEAARATIPQGRLGSAEDCVGAYLFLATDALSGYVTGQVIEVNGGQLMP